MKNGKSIIENDIEKYTAFLELTQRGLQHATHESEPQWVESIQKHNDVLNALKALQLHIQKP